MIQHWFKTRFLIWTAVVAGLVTGSNPAPLSVLYFCSIFRILYWFEIKTSLLVCIIITVLVIGSKPAPSSFKGFDFGLELAP